MLAAYSVRMRKTLTLLTAGALIACNSERPDFGQAQTAGDAEGGAKEGNDASIEDASHGSGKGTNTNGADASTSNTPSEAGTSTPSGSSEQPPTSSAEGGEDAGHDAAPGEEVTNPAQDGGSDTTAKADSSAQGDGGVGTETDSSAQGDGGTTDGSATQDSGSSSSGTWCDEARADVNLEHFQCLDFETDVPDELWVPTVTGDATQAFTTERAFSLPTSFKSSVPAAAALADRTVSILSWTEVGATPVLGARIALRVNPTQVSTVAPPWTGNIALTCVQYGSGSVCLRYTRSEAFNGLFLDWAFTGGPAISSDCEVSERLNFELWNDVELSVDDEDRVHLTINGEQAVTDCDANFGADTVATFQVGLQSRHTTSQGWTVFFDNIVAETLR